MKKTVALFFMGWASIYANRTVLYPLLPSIGEQFSLTNTQIGAIASMYFFPYVAMQIPAGLLSDRWGYKRILVLFFLLTGVGMIGLGFASSSYSSLLLWIGLQGLGAGAFFATAYGFIMMQARSKHRGLIAAVINSGMGLGLAIGLIMAGPVYGLSNSWQLPFAILALPTLVMTVIFAFFLPDIRPQKKASKRIPLRKPDASILPLYAAFFCSVFAFWVVVTWGPSYLFREHGFEIGLAGSFIAIIAVVAIPAAIAVGRISDRIGRKLLSQILLPLAALSIVGIAEAKSWGALLAVIILYGLVGKLTWDPIATSWTGDWISNRSPASSGTAMGILNFAGMFSAVVAPPISGWITDVTGSLTSAFYLAAALLLAGTIFISMTKETIEKEP